MVYGALCVELLIKMAGRWLGRDTVVCMTHEDGALLTWKRHGAFLGSHPLNMNIGLRSGAAFWSCRVLSGSFWLVALVNLFGSRVLIPLSDLMLSL